MIVLVLIQRTSMNNFFFFVELQETEADDSNLLEVPKTLLLENFVDITTVENEEHNSEDEDASAEILGLSDDMQQIGTLLTTDPDLLNRNLYRY